MNAIIFCLTISIVYPTVEAYTGGTALTVENILDPATHQWLGGTVNKLYKNAKCEAGTASYYPWINDRKVFTLDSSETSMKGCIQKCEATPWCIAAWVGTGLGCTGAYYCDIVSADPGTVTAANQLHMRTVFKRPFHTDVFPESSCSGMPMDSQTCGDTNWKVDDCLNSCYNTPGCVYAEYSANTGSSIAGSSTGSSTLAFGVVCRRFSESGCGLVSNYGGYRTGCTENVANSSSYEVLLPEPTTQTGGWSNLFTLYRIRPLVDSTLKSALGEIHGQRECYASTTKTGTKTGIVVSGTAASAHDIDACMNECKLSATCKAAFLDGDDGTCKLASHCDVITRASTVTWMSKLQFRETYSSINVKGVYPEATCLAGSSTLVGSVVTANIATCVANCNTDSSCVYVRHVLPQSGTEQCYMYSTCTTSTPLDKDDYGGTSTTSLYDLSELSGATKANFNIVIQVKQLTSAPTKAPTAAPTPLPTTAPPTPNPTSKAPTKLPTPKPTSTLVPTNAPSKAPTKLPTLQDPNTPPTPATNEPTSAPVTAVPTAQPTIEFIYFDDSLCPSFGKTTGCNSVDVVQSSNYIKGLTSAIYINQNQNSVLTHYGVFGPTDCTKITASLYVNNLVAVSADVSSTADGCLISWNSKFESTAKIGAIDGFVVFRIDPMDNNKYVVNRLDTPIQTTYIPNAYIFSSFTAALDATNRDKIALSATIEKNMAVGCQDLPSTATFNIAPGFSKTYASTGVGVYVGTVTISDIMQYGSTIPNIPADKKYLNISLTVDLLNCPGKNVGTFIPGKNWIEVFVTVDSSISGSPFISGDVGQYGFASVSYIETSYVALPSECVNKITTMAGLSVAMKYAYSYPTAGVYPAVSIANPGLVDGVALLYPEPETCTTSTLGSLTIKTCTLVYKTAGACFPMDISNTNVCTFFPIGEINTAVSLKYGPNEMAAARSPLRFININQPQSSCNIPKSIDVSGRHEVLVSAAMGDKKEVTVTVRFLNEPADTSTTPVIQAVKVIATADSNENSTITYTVDAKKQSAAAISGMYYRNAMFCRYLNVGLCKTTPFFVNNPHFNNPETDTTTWRVANKGYYACQDVTDRSLDKFSFFPPIFKNAKKVNLAITVTAAVSQCPTDLSLSRRMLQASTDAPTESPTLSPTVSPTALEYSSSSYYSSSGDSETRSSKDSSIDVVQKDLQLTIEYKDISSPVLSDVRLSAEISAYIIWTIVGIAVLVVLVSGICIVRKCRADPGHSIMEELSPLTQRVFK